MIKLTGLNKEEVVTISKQIADLRPDDMFILTQIPLEIASTSIVMIFRTLGRGKKGLFNKDENGSPEQLAGQKERFNLWQ